MPPASNDIPVTAFTNLYLGNNRLSLQRHRRRFELFDFLLASFKDMDPRAEYQSTARQAKKGRRRYE